MAKAVFEQLEVPWNKSHVVLLGVAKGVNRKAGLEMLFLQPHGEGIELSPDSPTLHVIQHIRDNSHYHAISGHCNKRAQVKNTSALVLIEGVGPRRRHSLSKSIWAACSRYAMPALKKLPKCRAFRTLLQKKYLMR